MEEQVNMVGTLTPDGGISQQEKEWWMKPYENLIKEQTVKYHIAKLSGQGEPMVSKMLDWFAFKGKVKSWRYDDGNVKYRLYGISKDDYEECLREFKLSPVTQGKWRLKQKYNYDDPITLDPDERYWTKGYESLTEHGLDVQLPARFDETKAMTEAMMDIVNERRKMGWIIYETPDGREEIRHKLYPISYKEYDEIKAEAHERVMRRRQEVTLHKRQEELKAEEKSIVENNAATEQLIRYWTDPSRLDGILPDDFIDRFGYQAFAEISGRRHELLVNREEQRTVREDIEYTK